MLFGEQVRGRIASWHDFQGSRGGSCTVPDKVQADSLCASSACGRRASVGGDGEAMRLGPGPGRTQLSSVLILQECRPRRGPFQNNPGDGRGTRRDKIAPQRTGG